MTRKKMFPRLRYCVRCNRFYVPSSANQKTCSKTCSEELKEKMRKKGIKLYSSEWRRKNPKRNRELHRDSYNRKRENVRELLGFKCVVCGSIDNIHYHEIHGKDHNTNIGFAYILNHSEDFICMCRYCHLGLHHLAKSKNVDWNKFMQLLKYLKNPRKSF